MPTFTYDPDRIGSILDALDATLFRLADSARKVEIDHAGKARHNDPLKATVSRDLLQAQQLAGLLEAEIGVLHMRFKGYPDPREMEVDHADRIAP